jgi:hypothetical protein
VCGWPLVEAKRREVLFECVVKVGEDNRPKRRSPLVLSRSSSASTGRSSPPAAPGPGTGVWGLENLHGIPADSGEFSEAGMTDPAVARSTFRSVIGREPTDTSSVSVPLENPQAGQRRDLYLTRQV